MNEIRPEFGNAPECPMGFTPNHKMDAVNEEKRYYRSQWLAEKDRADALAAHVERLTGLLREHHEDTPATSLARLIAETQLEALEAFGARNKLGVDALHDFLKTTSALRRQIEGGES